jgi:hypothetical protein
MFEHDPEINVVYDEEKQNIRLYVDNTVKADALAQLIPEEHTFGKIVVHVEIIPSNKPGKTKDSLFEEAFSGNPAFSFVRTIHGVFVNDITYVVFANKVVQYYNDCLNDIYGQRSCLYQDIAADIFGVKDGVFYCTDMPDDDVF